MGLRDVLADFLSSEGSHDRAGRDDSASASGGSPSSSEDAQGGEDAGGPPESGFDVDLAELDQEEQVEALEGRLDDIEGGMNQRQSELETIKGSQQDVAEQLNEVNDTVRQLLGIYDQLTADVNPFMEGPTRDADPDAEGFGVVGGEEPDPEGEVVEAVMEGDGVDEDAGGDVESADAEEATATIGLDDLRAEYEANADDEDAADDASTERAFVEDAVAAETAAAASDAVEESADANGADAAVGEKDEDSARPNNEIEVEPTTTEEPMSQRDVVRDVGDDADAWRDEDAGVVADGEARNSTAALGELADTYATEIIVFEWLTSLVSTAGPAATLRAIAYYEEIGWVSPQVKTYLEDVLSGPDLDVNVDPTRDPNELTAEDHAESYEYIMKLDAVQRTIDDTGL
jgi:archaellum component FlaD/FlaE